MGAQCLRWRLPFYSPAGPLHRLRTWPHRFSDFFLFFFSNVRANPKFFFSVLKIPFFNIFHCLFFFYFFSSKFPRWYIGRNVFFFFTTPSIMAARNSLLVSAKNRGRLRSFIHEKHFGFNIMRVGFFVSVLRLPANNSVRDDVCTSL